MIKKSRTLIRILSIIVISLNVESCTSERGVESITVALLQSPASEALIELLPNFEKETSIKVNYDILPYSDLKAKVEQQFIAKTGNYDVIMADCIWIPTFAERGFLKELDTTAYKPGEYDFKDLLPELEDYLGRYPKGGKRFGMPFMSNTHMMTYRPKMVTSVVNSLGYTLPGDSPETAWTWQQYLEVAKGVSDIGKKNTPQFYGTSLQARAGAWLVYEWNSVLFGFVADDEARITGLPDFDDRASKAMDYYAELYKVAPPEALTWGHEEETSAICSGQTAMDATSNVELAAILMDSTCSEVYGELAFAYPPIGITGGGSPDMGGYGLLLSAHSENPRRTSAFILWASSKPIHMEIVLRGGSPIRLSEIRNKDILGKYPYLKFYDRLIKDSVYRARVPEWTELEDIISRELTAVIMGEKRSQESVSEIQLWIRDHVTQTN